MSRPRVALALLGLAACLGAVLAAPVGPVSVTPPRLGQSATRTMLPVYLEDNHAGSFYWLAEHLDLDEPCRLLLFDAHSDASGVFKSDNLRTGLRRVSSETERQRVLADWRARGVVQCFGWIEPLMPLPFMQVVWVRPEGSDAGQNAALQAEAGEFLDGHTEAAPRESGSLRDRFLVRTINQIEEEFKDDGPLVISIDLDSFAGLNPAEQVAAFERVWRFCAVRKNLRAITLSVSRPFLQSDEEAHRLVELALRGALSLPTAVVQFEPFLRVEHDVSQKAADLREAGEAVPDYDISGAPESLRGLLLAQRGRISVKHLNRRWDSLLQMWSAQAPVPQLTLAHHTPSTDGIWRVPVGEGDRIVLRGPFETGPTSVEWRVLVPEYSSCNLVASGGEETGFALDAPARPRWREVVLDENDAELDFDQLAPFFDVASGAGSVRVTARIRQGEVQRETPPMEIRRFAGTGFRAALSEQGGLPYLFGSGELRDRGETGPETGWGADCANFMVYALRRQGHRIPWCDPRQLRGFLEPVASPGSLDQVKITRAEIERGVIIHFGRHVAAVMEDRGTPGVLDGEDLVAHHLEGLPETLPLGRLLGKRSDKKFDVLRVPPTPEAAALLLFGGDVMLGRTVGDAIIAGENPFAGIADVLGTADFRAVNLESMISAFGTPQPNKRYLFRAAPAAVETLKAADIDLVSVANNHALDYGLAARADCMTQLHRKGITALKEGGAKVVSFDEQEVFFVAFDATEKVSRALMAEALAPAGKRLVVVLIHWGQENTARVTEEQRDLARWLVGQGADLIVGCHPHVVQEVDFYRGRAIAYSLGNLVFDGAPGVKSWNEGALLRVRLSRAAFAPPELIPVRLDQRGFPQAN